MLSLKGVSFRGIKRSCTMAHSSCEDWSRALALSGALDEISNGDDGMGIVRYVRGMGLVQEGRTNKALCFFVYQTGRHGPQNGYRLCLVNEGVRPEDAREKLMGEVAQDAAEYVVLNP